MSINSKIKSASVRCSVLAILLLCLTNILQQPASASGAAYDISSYNTEIIIGTDNVYDITETISTMFNESRHGIFRYVPYRQEMDWDDNGVSKHVVYNTKVNSVSVQDDPFTTYSEDGNLVIQIGDANELVSGSKTYKIGFNHSLGNDKIESRDFVYYNLIGTNWDCEISNVSFKVTLPKEFDSSNIYFFSGDYSSSAVAPVTYTVDGNTITGTMSGTLSPGQGLTLQLDLPQGYFDVPATLPWSTILIVVSVLLALISLILFLRFGRDPVLVKPVEFYPPDAITSAEAGYIIDSSVDDKDVVSLIIYWASKGYLSIDQIDKNDFKLIKQKAMREDSNEYEKQMFGQLFNGRDTVTVSDLKENFYTTIDTTKGLISDLYSAKEKQLYDPKSLALRGLTFFLAGLLIFSTVFYTLYIEFFSFLMPCIISLGVTIIIILPFSIVSRTLEKWNGLKGFNRVSKLILNIILGVVFLLFYIIFMYTQGMTIVGVVAALAAAFTIVMSILMRKRTKNGNEVLGKLLGFKNFLEIAEEPRLQQLVVGNPAYFYDVIPFAYVLGVSDKWAKKFDRIAMRPPEWYGNSYDRSMMFNPLLFQMTLFHSMAVMNTNMVARPAPPPGSNSGVGGGGFGGGGFSGGGFGGGGGGSW